MVRFLTWLSTVSHTLFVRSGLSKLFLNPLKHKAVVHNNENETIPCSLLSGMPLGQKEGLEAISALEAMYILEQLWQRQHEVLDLIGGGVGIGMDGYQCYFYKVVPVLPNKYRPCNIQDGRRCSSLLYMSATNQNVI